MLEPLKTALSETLHLSKDALHIHVGLVIYLVAAGLTRRSLGSVVPWLILLALEAINEGFDLLHDLRYGGLNARSLLPGIKDGINTMLWPTVLLLTVRLGFLQRPKRAAAPDEPAGDRG